MSDLESSNAKATLLGRLPNMQDIERLNDIDFVETVFRSAVRGKTSLVRALLLSRGDKPLPVHFKEVPGSDSATLNGQGIELIAGETLADIGGSSQLKALFSLIQQSGMRGLIQPGATYPLLLRDIDSTVKRNRFRIKEVGFSGLLPELKGDVLSQPALALALQEESFSSFGPEAYRKVLCWASQDMVSQFPQQLLALTPVQTVNRQISMQDWKANYDPEEPVEATSITLGVNLSSDNTEFAKFLFSVMAPDSARLGLPDATGRVLCETTTDFLLSFPTVNHSADNAAAAEAFVRSYCPFEIIATQAAQTCARKFGHELREYDFETPLTTTYFFGRNELFEKLSRDNPLHEQVLNMMRKEQWLGMVKSFNSASASVMTLLALRDTFGIDNTSLPVHLSRSGMVELIEAGYRFADDTRVYECTDDLEVNRYNFSNRSSDVLLQFDGANWQPEYGNEMPTEMVQGIYIKQYQQIMSTNLWPAPIIRPVDVKEALDMLVEHDAGIPVPLENTTWALRAFLATAGLEACMQAATTKHWDRLMGVFPKADFMPHLKALPHKAKGILLEDEIGL
jgi:hypothetical protein